MADSENGEPSGSAAVAAKVKKAMKKNKKEKKKKKHFDDGFEKKKKKRKQKESGEAKKKHKKSESTSIAKNPAFKPDQVAKTSHGFKKHVIKITGPWHTSDINKENHWHFVLRSNKNEWIKVNVDSFSTVLFGTYLNPAYVANNPAAIVAAQFHALRAKEGLPQMYLDPSILGAGFISRVDVSINNVPVPTNSAIAGLFGQYARNCYIWNADSNKVYLAKASDINFAGRGALNAVTRKATDAFDFQHYDATQGARIPIPMNGIFPFDIKNKTIESIDGIKKEGFFLPPDTCLEINLHMNKSVLDSIFHPLITIAGNYWDAAQVPVANDLKNLQLKYMFQTVSLEYESAEMRPEDHIESMKKYSNGNGIFLYDIARGQHQALVHSQSLCINNFQIMPQCRLVYISFSPDWATFNMEAQRKPLSGFSRFPQNASDMVIGFAGETNLVTEKFVNFGVAGVNNEISKKIHYQYLIKNKMFKGAFEDIFPSSDTEISLIQTFVLDLKNYLSEKTEHLSIKALFAGQTSPKNCQIVVLSVHTNGKAICQKGEGEFEWNWSFEQGI